jgi:lipopolysaccharide/colanic/teichoic acid biosynthesis glycosyltransferase
MIWDSRWFDGGTVVKRIVDVGVASLLLLLSLPVLLLAAMLIVLTSPGPVLFRQVRMGRGFQTFEMLKLRTMAHAEAGLAYTLGPDPRITAVGRWLRRSKLDELPQLWNVLRGDMSLVGPRPVLPELTQEFREFYTELLQGRPGITDPASLKYREETQLLARARDPMHFFKTVVTPDKIRMSLDYMGRANVWTDAKVLAMTGVVCFFPALSRLYGDVPEVWEDVDVRKARRETVLAGMAAAADGAIFSHELAHLEASLEESAPGAGSPWIRSPNPDLRPESSALRAKESASGL